MDPYCLFMALYCWCSAFTSFPLRNHHMTFTGMGILIKEKILIFVFSGTVILNKKKKEKKKQNLPKPDCLNYKLVIVLRSCDMTNKFTVEGF